MNFLLRVCCLGMLLGLCVASRADAVLLLESPINFVGEITSAGHVALWMDRVCSDDHTHVRRCGTGEPGTVVSRYAEESHKLDWLAMSPGPYLFAVDRAEDVPATMSQAELDRLRTRYKAAHGASFAEDPGEPTWVSLTGEAYRRHVVAVRVHTTEADDKRLMAWLNDQPNVSHFKLLRENCADFIAEMLNVLYPGAIRRSYVFDLGMMTPKQVGSRLHRYARRHKELGWEVREVPQVPGEITRSGHMYGVTEAYLKHWWFLLPLDYLAPYELGPVTVSGLCDHRDAGKPRGLMEREALFRGEKGTMAGVEAEAQPAAVSGP